MRVHRNCFLCGSEFWTFGLDNDAFCPKCREASPEILLEKLGQLLPKDVHLPVFRLCTAQELLIWAKPLLEIIPVSVVAENSCLPVGWNGSLLQVAVEEPGEKDFQATQETHDRLRFILNREIELVLVPGCELRAAIATLLPETDFGSE